MLNEQNFPPPLGRLPRLTNPTRYQGLYVVDFGDGLSVGYVAGEVALLFDSGQFPRMQAFRIHRAQADGMVELVKVSRERFRPDSDEAMLFLQESESLARDDFDTLRDLAEGQFPCPARLEFAEIPGRTWPYMTVLIYAAGYTEEVSRFLLSVNYEGGETIEVGTHELVSFRQANPRILEFAEIRPAPDKVARSLDDLLAARQYAVQR
jgi:hypothetical protein